MIEEQITYLEQLLNSEGWKVYGSLLKDRFDREYAKLRNCKKSDSSYAKICGFLNGIDIATNVAQEEIDEYNRSKEPQP